MTLTYYPCSHLECGRTIVDSQVRWYWSPSQALYWLHRHSNCGYASLTWYLFCVVNFIFLCIMSLWRSEDNLACHFQKSHPCPLNQASRWPLSSGLQDLTSGLMLCKKGARGLEASTSLTELILLLLVYVSGRFYKWILEIVLSLGRLNLIYLNWHGNFYDMVRTFDMWWELWSFGPESRN